MQKPLLQSKRVNTGTHDDDVLFAIAAHVSHRAGVAFGIKPGNKVPPIMTNPNGLFRQTIYHPYSWALQYAPRACAQCVDRIANLCGSGNGCVGYIDAAATMDPQDGKTTLFVLNRDLSKARQVEVVWEDTPKTRVAVSQVLMGNDLKTVNGFDAPERVKPQPFDKPSTTNGRSRFEVPARSYTIIQW